MMAKSGSRLLSFSVESGKLDEAKTSGRPAPKSLPRRESPLAAAARRAREAVAKKPAAKGKAKAAAKPFAARSLIAPKEPTRPQGGKVEKVEKEKVETCVTSETSVGGSTPKCVLEEKTGGDRAEILEAGGVVKTKEKTKDSRIAENTLDNLEKIYEGQTREAKRCYNPIYCNEFFGRCFSPGSTGLTERSPGPGAGATTMGG